MNKEMEKMDVMTIIYFDIQQDQLICPILTVTCFQFQWHFSFEFLILIIRNVSKNSKKFLTNKDYKYGIGRHVLGKNTLSKPLQP